MRRVAPRHNALLFCGVKQERLGRGEYNAATTRVLHFKFNPEAEMAREARDARLAELESENEALRQTLGRLEAAAAQASGPAALPACVGRWPTQLRCKARHDSRLRWIMQDVPSC